MIKFWYIGDKGDFFTTRSKRIGASDVPATLINPEKPTESLAGYGRTAITVYQQKRGEIGRSPAGLEAEIGHYDENKSLELFIRMFSGYKAGVEFRIAKERYETAMLLAKMNKTELPNACDYQTGLYRHNTQYYTDGMIAHADCIYMGEVGAPIKTIDGITVDLSKPFYLESKSAQKYATKRPDDSFVKGYDFSLTSWQGIPLKHFTQMQYQSALLQIDVGYLPLLYDTSNFQIWRVDANKKWQGKILDTVGRLLKYIELGKMPREMAMNQADIIKLYPNTKKDFISVSGDAADKLKAICKKDLQAKQQIDNWKAVQQDCKDALSVHLKDYDEIRSGSEVLAKWSFRKGSEKIVKIDPKNKKDSIIAQWKKNDINTYRYMVRKEYVQESKPTRSVSVKWKGGE